jgi:competence protein ComEC
VRPAAAILDEIERQRGHLFPWVPVVLAAGIAGYFALKSEPGAADWGWVGAALGGFALGSVLLRGGFRIVAVAGLVALSGFAVAGLRAHAVAGVTLEFRFYGAIQGRIVGVDRSASDALRLTLDRVVLEGVPPGRTPGRVRVSLHGRQGFLEPEPGVTVILTGHLSPPGGAVEPGGYDFRRQAWFEGLGAVGYTRTPVLALLPHDGRGIALAVYRLRTRISAAVQAALPGQRGAVAAALTTGDRAGISEETWEALRASNLAHLLAISGLHMGLLTGFVFASLRFGMAPLSLYLPVRKIAAAVALASGAAYLALSGGNVATERAFVMVAVMLLAVLADRRAVTLRSVAVAALIVLTLRPEALLGPGFQMSFAATTALVAVYGALRGERLSPARWPLAARVVGGVALSSLVAGLATAPIGAAHFNQVPHYGLIANVVSVPLMGMVIIPGAVLAALLSPFGLGWLGLAVMSPAIGWILAVAGRVAGWEGAVSHVAAPGPAVLPLLALGALWLVLWQGRGRVAGIPVMAAALVLWHGAERPEVLVSQSGGLVGVMTTDGRALSKARGEGFAAETWLENDGDGGTQEQAFARMSVFPDVRRIVLKDAVILHATGKVASKEALAACSGAAVLVVNVPLAAPAGCEVYDARRLGVTGALAIRSGPEGLVVTTAREVSGVRLWSPETGQ